MISNFSKYFSISFLKTRKGIPLHIHSNLQNQEIYINYHHQCINLTQILPAVPTVSFMGKRPSSESHHISFLCIIPSRTALNLYFYFLTLLNPRLNFYRMTIILGLPSVFSRWNSSYTFWCEYHRNKVSSYRWCLRSLASLLHCKLLFFFPISINILEGVTFRLWKYSILSSNSYSMVFSGRTDNCHTVTF